MDKIGSYLIKNDIKPSIQRLKIFEFLYNNKNHPTVDSIYTALSPSIPTLSKTTVYNTLKLFISKGIVRSIHIEDHEVRYDTDTIPHGHFKCIGCGGLFDFPFDHQLQLQTNLNGFKITEEHFYLKGFCKLCGAN